jgi:type I restriction-modification system DNA methylase subunit
LRDLRGRARAQQLKADFEAYLDGFSPNVQEILDKFKFRNQIPTLMEADILGSLIEKFLDHSVNLNTALSPVCVSPNDECNRPESIFPSPPHACPWDQGCYNAMDKTDTRREI